MLHTMKIQIFYWNFAVSRTKWSPWIVFIIAWQSNDYKLQCEYNRIGSKPMNELHITIIPRRNVFFPLRVTEKFWMNYNFQLLVLNGVKQFLELNERKPKKLCKELNDKEHPISSKTIDSDSAFLHRSQNCCGLSLFRSVSIDHLYVMDWLMNAANQPAYLSAHTAFSYYNKSNSYKQARGW